MSIQCGAPIFNPMSYTSILREKKTQPILMQNNQSNRAEHASGSTAKSIMEILDRPIMDPPTFRLTSNDRQQENIPPVMAESERRTIFDQIQHTNTKVDWSKQATTSSHANDNRATSSSSRGNGKRPRRRVSHQKTPTPCECRNCKELQMLDPKVAAAKRRAGVTTHPCHIDDCLEVFDRPASLKCHLRWHTSLLQPGLLVCRVNSCGRKFNQLDDLRRHERTHKHNVRHLCPICRRSFLRHDQLHKHVKTHNQGTGSSSSGSQHNTMDGGTRVLPTLLPKTTTPLTPMTPSNNQRWFLFNALVNYNNDKDEEGPLDLSLPKKEVTITSRE